MTCFLKGGGHKSRQADHVPTCVRPGLKRYTVGGDTGGDFENKNIQSKFIFFVLFHVKDIEDKVYGM